MEDVGIPFLGSHQNSVNGDGQSWQTHPKKKPATVQRCARNLNLKDKFPGKHEYPNQSLYVIDSNKQMSKEVSKQIESLSRHCHTNK